MIRPAIVIIAYNRERPLRRLLHSVAAADYPGNDITLIISVDKANDGSGDPVKKAAEEFEWTHGEKRLIFREENMGLKKHVLSCGDLSAEYGAIIMLEDDLYVSPAFYAYAMQALEYVEKDDRIGGISLYDHKLNVHVREPFEAIHTPYDNWYLQIASSWGQIFSKEQWEQFRAWLAKNDNTDLHAVNMPQNISGWSDKSWLKYCIKYLIDTDRYFFYPSVSYTTNFSDEGEHAKEAVNDLQVPLSDRRGEKPFSFNGLKESRSIYDAFFENVALKKVVAEKIAELTGQEVGAKDVTIDLYGYRMENVETRYLLSSKPLAHRSLKGYARQLRPHDENIFLDLEGADFFLYDLDTKADSPKVRKISRLLYNYKALKAGHLLSIALYRLKQKL